MTYYVKVLLDDYPSAGVVYEPFTIKIKACQLTALTTDSDAALIYNIYTPVDYMTYSAFGQDHVPGTESDPTDPTT